MQRDVLKSNPARPLSSCRTTEDGSFDRYRRDRSDDSRAVLHQPRPAPLDGRRSGRVPHNQEV